MVFRSLNFAIAQRKVMKVYAKQGTIVAKVHNRKIIVYHRINFYFADGVWYKKVGRGYQIVNV